jgi:hypothetical protein
MITLERTPFTDWKYAILVNDKERNFIWKVSLDNTMDASAIEKEIKEIIKKKQ